MFSFKFRIVSTVTILSLVATLLVVPASATSSEDDGSSVSDVVSVVTDFGEFIYPHIVRAGNYIFSWFNDDICPDSFNEDGLHNFVQKRTQVDGVIGVHWVCEYCGKSAGDVFDSAYDDYVSTLDSTTDSNTAIPNYGTGVTYSYYSSSGVADAFADMYDDGVLYDLCQTDGMDYYLGYKTSSVHLFLSTVTVNGYYRVFLGCTSSISPYTSSSISVLCDCSSVSRSVFSNISIFVNYDEASRWWSNTSGACYFLCKDTSLYIESNGCVSLQDVGYISSSGVVSSTSVPIHSLTGYALYYVALPASVTYSTNYDTTTRPAALTQVINTYNTNNYYGDNATVNYYIGTTGEDGSVTNFYDMSVYDEETLVFTEPVTGAQYQTTGWTYDYTTRSYDIELESGTFTIDDTDIVRVVVVYGDDQMAIAYADADDNVIATDYYDYVMVASDECTLYGHSYTYENISDPTCTGAGERKYTCSVCGDEYAEEISMLEHSYTFSIIKEASCSSAGLGVYTCSGCGMQYTETIPATEHTGVLIETVPTEYGDSGTVITVGYSVYECTECGTQYTVYDDVGDNSDSGTSFWNRIINAFSDALASIIESLLSFITTVLEKVLVLIKDLLAFFFDFLSETVIAGLANMFAAFFDGSLFEFFQQTDEDGNTSIALPDGVAVVFTFFSGVIMALPWELRSVLIFGVGALVLIAIFKLARS